jgi:hypothetical protein
MQAFETRCIGEMKVVYRTVRVLQPNQQNDETFDTFLSEHTTYVSLIRVNLERMKIPLIETGLSIIGIRDNTIRKNL